MDFASISPLINTALSFAFGAWVGPYIGGYSKTKGENLATHEDIDKLVEQVKAVTATTEQIKTEISDAAWNRQKRWELKREVLFKALSVLTEVDQALCDLDRAVQIPQRISDDWHQRAAEKFEVVRQKQGDFDKTMQLVAVTCGTRLFSAFMEFGLTATIVAREIASNHNPDTYKEYSDDFLANLTDVRAAVRKELGIEEQG